MDVTEVRVFLVEEDRLRAYVTIIFDHCFVVRDLKVINGNNGLFVAMPSKKRKDGTYRDTAHPLDSRTRQMIESKVLAEYSREIQKNKRSHANEMDGGAGPGSLNKAFRYNGPKD